jgi:predicted PhzF superfamily epimerase YddE/YHI9
MDQAELVVEQGMEIGKDGRVYVHVRQKEGIIEVAISRTAVYADVLNIEY